MKQPVSARNHESLMGILTCGGVRYAFPRGPWEQGGCIIELVCNRVVVRGLLCRLPLNDRQVFFIFHIKNMTSFGIQIEAHCATNISCGNGMVVHSSN